MNNLDKSLTFGIDIIDADHSNLFRLIHIIRDECAKDSSDKDVLLHAVKELRGYANTHFKREEAIMLAANYDAFNPHRVEHEYFERMINSVFYLYQYNEELINIHKLMDILELWLVNHIGVVDRAYVKTVNEFCKKFTKSKA
jgi:hemerythrin-like metal-binding protein